jgi:hypothetical protein
MKYEICFELEVTADTPEQAVVIARDILLDPDCKVAANIYPFEYVEEAEDFFPTHKHGWFSRFDNGSVRPDYCIAWEEMRHDDTGTKS